MNSTAKPPMRCLFQLDDDVSVLVSELDFKAGGVGMRVTPSALFLSEWMLERRSAFAGARVLELGAGLGFNGLAAAAMGAASVCLTDYSPMLLENLKGEVAECLARKLVPPTVSVMRLDWAEEALATAVDRSRRWTADDDALLSEHCTVGMTEQFDVIIAADFLYEIEHAHWLPHVVQHHLAEGGQFNAAMAVRSVEILSAFRTQLQTAGFAVTVVSLIQQQPQQSFEGWTLHYSHQKRRPYYYHAERGRSVWNKPAEFAEAEAAADQADELAGVGADFATAIGDVVLISARTAAKRQ